MMLSTETVISVGTHNALAGQVISSKMVMKPRQMPRILLVDDDPVFCKVLSRAAAVLHAPLEAVSSLAEMIDRELGAFDVAIIDYQLAGVTGLELTRYLDSRSPMPVVMISGSVRRPDRRWSESIHDFVLKDGGPFAIVDAAFEAYEINLIHRQIAAGKRRRQ